MICPWLQFPLALEPTGDYHRPLAYRLLREGFEVVSVSSVAQARFRVARYGTWDKNDPKDAQVILATRQQGLVQTYYDPFWQGTHDWQELANPFSDHAGARSGPDEGGSRIGDASVGSARRRERDWTCPADCTSARACSPPPSKPAISFLLRSLKHFTLIGGIR